MAIWPWKKRSKTNSGDKRPTNNINEGSLSDPELPAPRPRTPSSVRSISKSKRRNDTFRAIKRATSRRKNNYTDMKASARPSTPPSQTIREVQMSSPPPTQSPVAQLQTPAQTPPPSQQAFTPTTPENRRSNSSASSHRPRKRTLLKKSPTFPSSEYPSPPPDKEHPRLFRSFSKRTQRGLFSRREQIERPLSETSMRTQESLQSAMTSQSHSSPFRAFKVRSFDVLAPRPTLRLSANPYAGEKIPDYPSGHQRKPSKPSKSSRTGWKKHTQSPIVEESPIFRRNLVYGLADDLDSKGIREALERDARRRERKQKLDEERAQAKLERRAAKQRAEDEQAAALSLLTSQGSSTESPAGPSGTQPAKSTYVEESSGPRSPKSGTQTPMSWFHGPSQENLTIQTPNQRPLSSGRVSYRSDHDTPIVQTATAVRLSGLSGYSSASDPPPSPTAVRNSIRLVDHSPSHSRKMSRDQGTMLDNLPDPEENKDSQALENAWTSFFRKATAARVQKEHEAQQQALLDENQTTDTNGRDEISTVNGSAAGPNGSSSMPRTFLQSPTPKSAGSRAPSDQYLPDIPTPRLSQIAIPVPHDYAKEETTFETRKAPLSPTRMGASSSLSRTLSEARRPSKKANGKAPWSSQGEIVERYGHASSHFSETSSRNSFQGNDRSERVKSMASIESEGSWLSGRFTNSRQSTRQIPSFRDSAQSLKFQYRDIKGYEDKRASTADDQFFSGVQDEDSSDEDERDILNGYLDDDRSIRGPSAQMNYPSSRSPTSDQGDDSDADLAGDQYLWREGFGRRPIVMRVDSNFVQKREEIGSFDDASSMDTAEYPPASIAGELIIEDNDGNMIVPDRGRNSPSPTLGKHNENRFKSTNGASPFLSSAKQFHDISKIHTAMSFRKRSVVLSTSDANKPDQSTSSSTGSAPQATPPKPLQKGVRPSFLTGVPTTSTGTASLDNLLSGHEGLPLGSLLLVEESSTTDFAGALLRYYAAEGIVQAHNVVVVGVGEAWGRELPGLSDRKDDNEDIKKKGKEERMKIAWRYEVLGNRRVTPESSPSSSVASDASTPSALFCHTYDLTKRLTIPSTSKPPTYIPPPPPTSQSPFTQILAQIQSILTTTSANDSVTRIVIPNLLSPLIYPPSASHPTNILRFIHTLRSLTRQYSHILTIMISLPLSLYPRSTGLVRQLEHLTDTTIELHPVPAFLARAEMRKGVGNTDDVPQGLVHVWKAIEGKRGTGIVTNTGGDGSGGTVGMEGGDDLAFMLTRRRMRIERFSLPVDDDDDAAEEHKVHNPSSTVGEGVGGIVDGGRKATKVDLEF
ncbi:hypothetical protein H072_6010 [Dactylellina haptotyla CBS 200.50]|uniref:Elongator complex protein 4 n=1 Tax=Dactylellina haptotyla (strain CBS 200.50) TaxID=1284197 RepID=S8BY02_DACHA|nr:hypothetical protein H072_6010 [Dactylellina haptotyla CBS 200.50]